MNIVRLLRKRTVKEWVKYVKDKGLKHIYEKILYSSSAVITGKYLARKPLFSDKELIKQKEYVFDNPIKFSVLVPLFNTNKKYLIEMIESVEKQTYNNWELCLADGSDTNHEYVSEVCREYVSVDSRIKYKKLEKNIGISANTNECIKMSTGEYLVLFDHDDILHPAALFEMMTAISCSSADFLYTDEAKFATDVRKAYDFHFKPCFAPDTLLSNNYICHLSAFSRELLDSVGGFRSEYDGSQDHDFILRATDAAKKVVHIPEVLYFWRSSPESVAQNPSAKPYASIAGIKAVKDYLQSKGITAEVNSVEACPSIYRIKYELLSHPKVSIIIPNCEHLEVLRRCIDSVLNKTTYDNYNIFIIENNSQSDSIFNYYSYLEQNHDNIKILKYDGSFNYSRINNFGANNADGEVLILLNNDIEIITPDWIQEMLMFAQRDDVGAVGAKLYYPDNKIQHAGVVLGAGGIAGNSFYRMDGEYEGYMGRLSFAQNMSAVTGACLMLRHEVFDMVSGFNEDLAVAFNDVDLCLKIRKQGKLVIWTPFAELYHYESISRGDDLDKKNIERFKSEIDIFENIWGTELADGDPYYNPNFKIDNAKCYIKRRMRPYKQR